MKRIYIEKEEFDKVVAAKDAEIDYLKMRIQDLEGVENDK